MGFVGSVVIARWSWTLMHDTAAVLLDRTDPHVAAEIRALVEDPGDARIADLHVWRVGPEAHAAIVSVVGAAVTGEAIRARLAPIHELAHLTGDCRGRAACAFPRSATRRVGHGGGSLGRFRGEAALIKKKQQGTNAP